MRRAAAAVLAPALLALGALLAAGGCLAEVAVARVNGVVIAQSALDVRQERMLRERNLHVARLSGPRVLKELRREALDALVREELFWQQAQRAGLIAADAEVEEAVARMAAQFRSPAAFRRKLASEGFDERGYRDHVRRLLSAERHAQAVVAREGRVADEDVEAFYRGNAQSFARPELLQVRQILARLPPQADAEAVAQATARLERLRARALAGESFEQLAREHSDDATRQWGGEMDPFPLGSQAPEFESAALALAPGAISPPVRTAPGLHLIQLQRRIPALTVPPEEARARIAAHLREERGREAIAREEARLRATEKVEILLPP